MHDRLGCCLGSGTGCGRGLNRPSPSDQMPLCWREPLQGLWSLDQGWPGGAPRRARGYTCGNTLERWPRKGRWVAVDRRFCAGNIADPVTPAVMSFASVLGVIAGVMRGSQCLVLRRYQESDDVGSLPPVLKHGPRSLLRVQVWNRLTNGDTVSWLRPPAWVSEPQCVVKAKIKSRATIQVRLW